MTDHAAVCGECGAPGDPQTRFCRRCGRAMAPATAQRPAPARRPAPASGSPVPPADDPAPGRARWPGRRPGALAMGLIASLLIVTVGLVVVDDRGDGPTRAEQDAASTRAQQDDRDEPTAGAPGPADDVDIGPDRGDTLTEAVGGLACRGPDETTTCVTHLAELDLTDDDEVRMIRGRIVVARQDGTVSAHSLRDGEQRWQTRFEPPVTLHPDVAESIPVASADALHVVDLASGNRIGRIDVEPRQVAAVGPWIVVDDGDRLGAFGVTGQPGWTRELDGASALLSSSGTYVRSPGSLAALFGNTGEPRFDTEITGPVGAITQQDGRVMLVTDEPPQIRSIAADGTTRSRTPLPGSELAWAGFTPDGERLAALTQDGDGNLQWLTLVDRFQAGPPRQIPLSGTRGPLDPVLDDRVLLLPYHGATADLLVIDLDTRSVVNRVALDRPLTDLGLAGAGGFATIDDAGILRVQGLRASGPAYTVALGPGAQLLQARPLLVRTERAVVAFDDPPGNQGRGTAS